MKLEANGITIELEFDGDGFPLISIDTGGGFYAENYRPTVEVKLNDVEIHDMFDEEDTRWNDPEDDEADGYFCTNPNCQSQGLGWDSPGECNDCGHELKPAYN